jgi:hypothetical protein
MKTIISIAIVITVIFFLSCEKENATDYSQQNNTQIETSNTSTPYYLDERFVSNVLEFNDQLGRNKTTWEKIKKWILAHSGRQPQSGEDCGGNGGCGPCAAICLSGSVIPADNIFDESTITEYQYNIDNLREWSIEQVLSTVDTTVVDSMVIIEFLRNPDDFLNESDELYIPSDIDLGSNLATVMERTSLILKAGTYSAIDDRTVIVVE